MSLQEGHEFHTAYRTKHNELFNGSGLGDTRFAPLTGTTGGPIPTLYGASTRTVALLETTFHEVDVSGVRVIYEATDVRGRGLVTLHAPERLVLFDLRDEALADLRVARSSLVATSPLHYQCTRAWATFLHGRRVGRSEPVGILWHSRLAELARAGSPLFEDLLRDSTVEVFVLFGDGVPTDRASYRPSANVQDLTTGSGRVLLDRIALELEAVIV